MRCICTVFNVDVRCCILTCIFHVFIYCIQCCIYTVFRHVYCDKIHVYIHDKFINGIYNLITRTFQTLTVRNPSFHCLYESPESAPLMHIQRRQGTRAEVYVASCIQVYLCAYAQLTVYSLCAHPKSTASSPCKIPIHGANVVIEDGPGRELDKSSTTYEPSRTMKYHSSFS